MYVILLANLPLPVIFYLNLLVTYKYWTVHRLARRHKIAKPPQFIQGWWLGNISLIFALIPILSERTIFIQNRWWLISFAVSATLEITGLSSDEHASELQSLSRRGGGGGGG